MKLRRYAKKQAQQLCKSLAKAVAEGDVDAVHQVRVGCRRLEEPLQLCRSWVSDKKIDKAIQQLTRLRRKFRKIRDGEVTLRVVNPLQLRFAHEKKEPSPGRAAGRAGRAAGAGR